MKLPYGYVLDGERIVIHEERADIAYGTQCGQVIPGLRSDRQLARYYVEKGMIPELREFPGEQLDLLNYPLLGEARRKAEGGVFVPGNHTGTSGYVRQTAVIARAHPDLTPKKPDYSILLSVAGKWIPGVGRAKTALLELPVPEDELTAILAEYDGLGEDDAVWNRISCSGVDCAVPQLTGMIFDYASERSYSEAAMRFLNDLAGKLARATPETLSTYKALLSAMDCRDLCTAGSLLDTADSFTLLTKIKSPADIAEQKLSKLRNQGAGRILPHVDMEQYGKALIEEAGGELTPYGLLLRRNGEPVLDSRQKPVQTFQMAF